MEISRDFWILKRMNLGKVNKKVVESLIKAGAFDSINSNRAELLGNLPTMFEYASKTKNVWSKEGFHSLKHREKIT